ncbi:MAG TPA: 5,6-dimethylbenzimidazole synthase [Stellaceae bacterium]|nr:5,6-dimethylbenzimidazole synthase [Stellaceae bacterium]
MITAAPNDPPDLGLPDLGLPNFGPPDFDIAFRRQLHSLIVWRRDVRRFRPDPLPPEQVERLLATACLSPSVGLSEPWRFVLVEDPARRRAVRDNFLRCNAAAATDYADERAARYARLKLAGLDEAPVHLAVFADRSTLQGHGLGRRTMPEAADYSVVTAIHTLWLTARAEGIGMGWVSILDPAPLGVLLDVPPDWRFIGYFCLGLPAEADDTPALERQGWDARHPSAEVLLRR